MKTETDRREPEENRDVHTEHCCRLHGCKYGDEDCPVETKQKKQSYACECCDPRWTEYAGGELQNDHDPEVDPFLFTVVTIAPAGEKYGGTRCVAVCTTLERAKQIIENNEGDIWETTYDLAMIETRVANWLYAGFYHQQWWYKWEGVEGWDGVGTKGYVSCETPDEYKQTFGFGIG